MSKRIALLSILSLGVLLVSACAAPSEGESPSEMTEEAGAKSEKSPRVAPAFTLPKVGGGEVSLAAGAGTVRLVDFWATWCAPCREEIPMLNELEQTYRDRGFQILAISTEEMSVIEAFLEEHPVDYVNLVGSEELQLEYGAIGMPTAFLIDAEGHVAEVYFGPKPRKALEKKIVELLDAS